MQSPDFVNDGQETESQQSERIFEAFRRWGYFESDLDPLGCNRRGHHPELAGRGPEAADARRIYSGTIGAEFMHLAIPERRGWIIQHLESEPEPVDRQKILEQLVAADLFEQSLQALYVGTKRFSLEGVTALIPMLEQIFVSALEHGVEECVMAMSHRGRLNVVANAVGRPLEEIYAGFEDVDPRSVLGGGDVKYHQGATNVRTIQGHPLSLRLVSNPSHLEAVDPVMLGRVRAKQERCGKNGRTQVLPIMMHGDAAFAGQGICAETLNLSTLNGFATGGTIHIIVDNQLGFTTAPREYTSSRFSSDLAHRLPVPVFHINAEDPENVVRLAKLAVEYRYRFASDVFIDLVGYRRHGHSEVDDPTVTQPKMYALIAKHPPLYEIYAERIEADPAPLVEAMRAAARAAKQAAQKIEHKPLLYKLPAYWDSFKGGNYDPSLEVPTALPRTEIGRLGTRLTVVPAGFHLHPKVAKVLEQRAEMADGKRDFDFGAAEALVFASLAVKGIPVRMSGQDSRRGTFSHRHSCLIDIETEQEFVPLQHLASDQAPVEIYNSELSEAAVLGFEYGFARDYPEALVLWEAQFGDFANGAQVIIDQFLAASEEKWGLLCGLTLLLPHGYEGQGAEHSSARIERYLQLCARHNLQVCQPSTAAQYFHLLRRQVLRQWRKPLIVFTPKSMLRHPAASSPIGDFEHGSFQPMLADRSIPAEGVTRILVASGKLLHELRQERERVKDKKTAILALEQFYPFPEPEVIAAYSLYSNAKEAVWVQEEPANMGALSFVKRRLRRAAPLLPLRTLKRAAAASPATGSGKAHAMEQKTLIALAFSS